jgi:hypothetical protein
MGDPRRCDKTETEQPGEILMSGEMAKKEGHRISPGPF